MCPSFPLGLFSHHSNRGSSLQDYPSFAGETVGTRIDRDNSLIMSLRLRGGYATECHAFSYFSSSSALIFSPPCGSHPEYAHSVYKYALNKFSFIHNCGNAAVHQITLLKNRTKSMHNKEEPLCESAQCT